MESQLLSGLSGRELTLLIGFKHKLRDADEFFIPHFIDDIAPGVAELRSAKALGVFSRENLRNRPIGPGDLLLRRLKYGSLMTEMHAHQARDALDHD